MIFRKKNKIIFNLTFCELNLFSTKYNIIKNEAVLILSDIEWISTIPCTPIVYNNKTRTPGDT